MITGPQGLKLLVHAEKLYWSGRIGLKFLGRDENTYLACELDQPLVFRTVPEGGALGGPDLEVSQTEAQALMDELWRCGLRPSEGSGSAGSLRATEQHLKDMQSIAFGLLSKHGVQK